VGILAWIVLGLAAGLIANMLIPGRRSQGLIITCLIGVAGALLGGLAGHQVVPHPQPAGILQPVHLADGHRRGGRIAARLPPGHGPVVPPVRPVCAPLTGISAAREGIRRDGVREHDGVVAARRPSAGGRDIFSRKQVVPCQPR
jgi:uncharacterized membrane protein YeaQ/YmgE (transglycosylase-associated protein family)